MVMVGPIGHAPLLALLRGDSSGFEPEYTNVLRRAAVGGEGCGRYGPRQPVKSTNGLETIRGSLGNIRRHQQNARD